MLGVVTGMFGGTGLLDALALEELLLFGEHVVPGPLSLKHPALEFEITTFIVNLFHVKVLYMIVMFFLQGWIGSPVKRFKGHLNIGRIQIPLNAEGISLQFSNRILTDQILAISRSRGTPPYQKYTNPSWRVLGEFSETSQPKTESLVVTVPFVKVRGYSGHEDM